MRRKTASKKTSTKSEIALFEDSLDTIMEETGIEYGPDISRSATIATTSQNQAPQAIQLNIQLNGADAGVQLAKRLADEYNVPFVVLNTDSNNRSSAEASVTIPHDYLNGSKEMIINALSSNDLKNSPYEELKATSEKISPRVSNAIFVKDTINYVKVPFENIDFVKSDGNYLEIHWDGKKSVLKKTLKSLEEKLPSHTFFQIHRSYMVNINKISSIGPTHLMVNKKSIPISKGKKEALLDILNTI